MAREPARKLSPPVKLGRQIAHGAEVHAHTADAVDVYDPANELPKTRVDQSVANKSQRFVLVERERIVRWFIALMPVDPTELTAISISLLLAQCSPCRCRTLRHHARGISCSKDLRAASDKSRNFTPTPLP